MKKAIRYSLVSILISLLIFGLIATRMRINYLFRTQTIETAFCVKTTDVNLTSVLLKVNYSKKQITRSELFGIDLTPKPIVPLYFQPDEQKIKFLIVNRSYLVTIKFFNDFTLSNCDFYQDKESLEKKLAEFINYDLKKSIYGYHFLQGGFNIESVSVKIEFSDSFLQRIEIAQKLRGKII